MKNRLKNLLLLPLLTVLIALSASPAAAYDYNPFTDISESAWYYRDVMNAVNAGLVNGKTKTTFCPDDYLTYAEAVKLASCLNQLWWTGEITLSNGSPWYQNYVDYAWTVGIIDDNYNWTGYASRGAFLAIFANAVPTDALGRINSVPDNSIPDVSLWYPNAWAIYALYRAGIVQGSDKAHSCYPDNPIKRSEVAAILTRMTDPSARLYFTMDSPDAASWDYEVYEDYEGYDTAEEEPANPKYWITVDFYDRDDLTVYTEGTTLGLILLENGIELAEGEVPSVDLWDDWLAEDMTVSVDKYAYRSEDVHRIEARTTEEIGIDTIPRGDVNILEEGADGESIMH
ncbi:MAG: S-layer homology domain-containing protein, partial [Clostridia bacterium]|nr:S-layer homology domain-containing protein [Clostridia bacterium]